MRKVWDWVVAPLVFLAVGATQHYLWAQFPAELQGMVAKGCYALAGLFLLWMPQPKRVKPMLGVLLWWTWEELQVAICSALYIREPWEVPPGQGICSAKIGLDLGSLGILIVAVLLYRITRFGSGNTCHREKQ